MLIAELRHLLRIDQVVNPFGNLTDGNGILRKTKIGSLFIAELKGKFFLLLFDEVVYPVLTPMAVDASRSSSCLKRSDT